MRLRFKMMVTLWVSSDQIKAGRDVSGRSIPVIRRATRLVAATRTRRRLSARRRFIDLEAG